jgi:N utilization substance protein B
MAKVTASARHGARKKALQALYQWQVSKSPVAEIEQYFLCELNPKKVDVSYFRELFTQVVEQSAQLDAMFAPFLDRTLTELHTIEWQVLRLGAYEFSARQDIPYRVVINEALELSKIYGAEDGHKYVNGVLDKLAAQLRSLEVSAHTKS